MNRRSLLISMIFMAVLAVLAVSIPVATRTTPTLGLDLQGGFSVVLQAKPVNGQLPSEEAVEKAKDIIRERVDGLGVAEPDITRQGRTVVVQLPGVRNREKAESVVGCTARLEFRPVLAVAPLPGADDAPIIPEVTPTVPEGDTTVPAEPATSTPAETPTTSGDEENGAGAVGIAPGEGALPGQFAPTTTSTNPPETTTSVAPETTVPETTTTVAESTTTVPGADEEARSTSCGGVSGSEANITTTTVAAEADLPVAQQTINAPSDDGTALYTLGPLECAEATKNDGTCTGGFTGDSLSKATAVLNQGQWLVSASVKGSEQSAANVAFNACYSGGPTCPGSTGPGAIAIVLDGQVLSAPAVQAQNLASDDFTISGSFDESGAKELALVLRYGSLPVEFEQAALQQVSATLGSDSLQAGLIAGLIGIALLALYMVLYYRGFGLVVVASLLVWASLMYGLICLLSEVQGLALTLAGITGIIVSVGTTVDTYIVVFERVKDEIRSGRSVRSATERGYDSGIRTVLTANGAAFIGAFLLWWLTIGPVRGFAYFLGLSVILDLFVAIVFSRPLILLLSRSPRFANARFFGIGASTDQKVSTKAVAS